MIIHSVRLHLAMTTTALFLLIVLPPLIIWLNFPQHLWSFFVGGMSWTAGVALKRLLVLLPVTRQLMLAGAAGAALWGFVSGVTELGALWLALTTDWMPVTLAAGVACGLGAASFEIAYLIVAGAIHDARHPDPEKFERWLAGARVSHWVAHQVVIERLGAVLLHVVTRAAVVESFMTSQIASALVALAMFTVVDGMATYGVAKNWDWFDPDTCRRFYTGIYSVGIVGGLTLAYIV